MSSCVFTDMQPVHSRMNSSLSPPLKKILDPLMPIDVFYYTAVLVCIQIRYKWKQAEL